MKSDENFKEILLLKCENYIRANVIVNLLNEHSIASRLHDEKSDPAIGAYGAVTGISVYVFEKDYDKALSIIEPTVKEFYSDYLFCPKCGSGNVTPIIRNRKFETYINLVSLFFIIIPMIYVALPTSELGFRSNLADITSAIMFVIGFVLAPIVNRNLLNYRCTDCGKKFHH